MDIIYISLIGILFLLAISDLIVGVSNDAVNFLNSAIGSKAAPFKIIMIVAAIGILVGATFSSGMMEVARKGIFHPQEFYFSEIMFIFLAVMITDVILLDLFNTFGLPTSTTVSIVFELLGAAVGISLLKMAGSGNERELGDFINSGKALAIISGILLSVVVAFSVGATVQYLTRILFSFRYEKRLKYFGAIWGSIAITAITYFILIKGAKGASFMDADMKAFIKDNTFIILLGSLIFWTLILQLLHWLVKLNILKLTVLVGTFALAMAFAGNDLVNFIGVPLAGLESFKAFIAHPDADPNMFLMESLQSKVSTPTLYLLIAGIIMVLTLWFSKKAKGVIKTTIDLSRQDEGSERFGSSAISRTLVRSSLNLGKVIRIFVPQRIQRGINKQFNPIKEKNTSPDAPSFDMIRASVNLVVASILIAFATSLKLPLSTTYVTFMVAMGTSLADKAWGRESAVYRITGVLSVIGGWFFTALSAFTVAFVLAMLFYWGGFIAIAMMVIIAGFVITKTHSYHKKKEEITNEQTDDLADINEENILHKCNIKVTSTISKVNNYYKDIIEGITNENLKQLKKVSKEIDTLNSEAKKIKDKLGSTIGKLQDDSIETGHYYVQVIDYLRETAHNISFLAKPCFEHIDNNHKGLIHIQSEELNELRSHIDTLLKGIIYAISNNDYLSIGTLINKQQDMLNLLAKFKKKQIKRIKHEEVGTKNSLLYLTIINETKNLILNSINLLKSQRDFTLFDEGKNKN
jgi:phosphate/sulfate permease